MIDSNGKLLVSGTTGRPGTYNPAYDARTSTGALWRFDDSGNFDSSFGTAGVAFSPLSSYLHAINEVVIQPGGRIIQQGADVFSGPGIGFAGFTPDGQLDTTFGTASSGVAAYNGGGVARTISVDATGRLLVTGDDGLDRFVVSRYHVNGSPDTTFDTLGHDELIAPYMGGVLTAVNYEAVIAPDGNILATGARGASTGDERMATAKYETARNDLSVVMTAPTTAAAGGTVTYTIQVENTGDDATFASWRMLLPADAVFLSAVAPPGWDWDASSPHTTGVVAATRNLRESDGEVAFTVTVQMAAGLPEGAQIISTVQATSAILDFETSNNSATATVTVVNNELPIAVNDSYMATEDTCCRTRRVGE